MTDDHQRVLRAIKIIVEKGWPDPFAAPAEITSLWDIHEHGRSDEYEAPGQFLLYQTWAGDLTYFATFDSVEEAAEYVNSDDWQTEALYDLDGDAVYRTTTSFRKVT